MAQKFDADFPKGSPYDAVSCIRSDAEYLAQLRSKCSTWLDFTSIVKRMNGDGMQQPGFGARIGLAFGAFFKILFNGEYAASILAIAGRSNDTVEMPGLTADTVPADPIQAVTATEPIPPSEDTAPTPPKAATPSREAKAAVTAHAHQRRLCARTSVFGAMGSSGEVWSQVRRARQWQSREHGVQLADGRAGLKRVRLRVLPASAGASPGWPMQSNFALSRGSFPRWSKGTIT